MSVRFIDFYLPEDELRLAELAAAAQRAKSASGNLPRALGEGDAYSEAAQAHDDFAEEMEKRRIRVCLKSLPRKEWRALVREHPQRPDVDGDDVFNVNMDTFPDVLVPRSIDREQSENLPENLEEWLESLSDAQYYGRDPRNPDGLFIAAWAANVGLAMLADPTQRLASAAPPTSAETSN